MTFILESKYQPCGDQPKAIEALVQGIETSSKPQVLLGITGSGKTFTMANVISRVQRPALILVHNKTLASQLYEEFKAFFPHNAVEYFVSYYDYYRPEAYIARTDVYIEKEMAINAQINRMRLSATRSLFEREDVIVVASVSAIYGLGMPEYFKELNLALIVGQSYDRQELLLHLVRMQYQTAEVALDPGTFRVRGEYIEIFPAYEEDFAFRLQFFDDELERITQFDPLLGSIIQTVEKITLYPASHHVVPEDIKELALREIETDLALQAAVFEERGQELERSRLLERVKYDLATMRELGYCRGIENYSRYFARRAAGEPPACLLDYFPDNFLLFVDESHQMLPQIHAMSHGDRSRKNALVTHGFHLPAAYDNRPMTFDEFYAKIKQVVYVSATPGAWEVQEAQGEVIEQIIRPTGLLDPTITVRPAIGQVDDVVGEIRRTIKQGQRILVTTLTKKMAEELSDYLFEQKIKAKYLHSEIDTIERIEILTGLRRGEFDVLVGINLLREGLDLPEVGLVAILDADKQGFLRSTSALIQTCGRAARNEEGRVVMYGDTITAAMQATIDETVRRRAAQEEYNRIHNITPKTVYRALSTITKETPAGKKGAPQPRGNPATENKAQSKPSDGPSAGESGAKGQTELEIDLNNLGSIYSLEELNDKYEAVRARMHHAAKQMQFDEAAQYRDLMRKLERHMLQLAQ
jgi:excinuclease ABC subunit B